MHKFLTCWLEALLGRKGAYGVLFSCVLIFVYTDMLKFEDKK